MYRMAGSGRRGNRAALQTAGRLPPWARSLVVTVKELPGVTTAAGKRWVIEILQAVIVHLQDTWGLSSLESQGADSRRVRPRRVEESRSTVCSVAGDDRKARDFGDEGETPYCQGKSEEAYAQSASGIDESGGPSAPTSRQR